MKQLIFIILGIGFSLSSRSQNFSFLPSKVNDHPILNYSDFSLSYNEAAEQADWVAYELTKEKVLKSQKRINSFYQDSRVPTKSANPDDYKSTGFDKGHLCPAADCKSSLEAYNQSFSMANISPQLPLFNREVWKGLEEWERSKAIEFGKIYVVSGPVFIYGSNLGRIGKNEVTIPPYFYKVFLRLDAKGKYHSIAFLLPQIGADKNYRKYVVPVNAIESLTGLDFFPALDSQENRIESQVYPNQWGL